MRAVGLYLALIAISAKGARLASGQISRNNDGCEKITIPMCENIPYSQTKYPNSLSKLMFYCYNVHIYTNLILLIQMLHFTGHNSQIEAAKEIHTYQPLVKINCSADIQLFLCSMYAPPCTILGKKFYSDFRFLFT